MSLQTNCYSMRTAFQLSLNASLNEGLAAIGRFDGKTPSLVCATNTRQVIVHTHDTSNPLAAHREDASVAPLRTFNFGKALTALATGPIGGRYENEGVDALFLGEANSLLAYDVERNCEYYYKQVEDGVSAVVGGVVGPTAKSGPAPLAIVGGDCAISGFNSSGEEVFSTITGDRVTALMLMPWPDAGVCASTSTLNGSPALVAASEDFELRVFDGEEPITSVGLADRVHSLVYSGVPGRFAYLSNSGTVGIYDRCERLYRLKDNQRPVSAAFCDVDMDGVPELIIGWNNGRVEVRSGDGNEGTVLCKETFDAPISSVLVDDYRQNGQPLPIICTVDGTVCGLQLTGTMGRHEAMVAQREGALKLDMLMREKQALEKELANVKEQLVRQKSGRTDVTLPKVGTGVDCKLQPNSQTGKLDVVFSVINGQQDTIIYACILSSEAMFPEKGHILFMSQDPLPTLVCGLDVPRGPEVTLKASVMVGSTNAVNYQVHEVDVVVPKFVMCRLWPNEWCRGSFSEPTGSVTLQLSKDFDFGSVSLWLQKTFDVPLDRIPDTASDFSVPFVDLQDRSGLVIRGILSRCELQICGNSMDICSILVESFATTCVTEATSRCDFPEDFQQLQETVERVIDLDKVRQKLSDDIAEAATNIKPLLVRAEDSRLISDIVSMRRHYSQLYELDKELIDENLKLSNNFKELKSALKRLNGFIAKAGKLRIGRARTQLVAECRECVKASNMQSLINLIRTGEK
ncbi:intergrin alpha chain protein, putative [Trypanosoma equiperdum]|uniref:Intergrin alpha chain protein, putative n=1 Tax=Trypanosoma equiperdum TaxID=5694 RepID=A0A1G4IAS2_TRYEQ|nr:intergrin alpha chain protein, putative [Trypanosoma equiperdum]